MLPRPLESRYGANLAVAIAALVPFIILTTAETLFRRQVGAALAADRTALSVIAGMSTAGYAFGALLAGDLIQRFPQRRLFLLCEALFVLGAALAAAAGSTAVYGTGLVLMGLATGLLLVIALPPVVRRFPARRLPVTTAVIDLGFFGAITVGPLVGGAVAGGGVWRWFYAALAVIGALNFGLALLTLPHQAPPDPDLRFDGWAIGLALPATVLPFWATGSLSGHAFGSYRFMLAMAFGLACFVALLLVQYHREESLSPVKPMWTTLPLAGVLAAMIGGGAFLSFLLLGERYLAEAAHRSPLATGLAFWPMVPGACIASMLLGGLIRTRWLPVLTLAGMLALTGGGALLLWLPPSGSSAALLAAAGLLGLGAGATVSPGLWMAGLSLSSKMVGRIFALVELVRSEADFVMAPVMLRTARIDAGGFHAAIRYTIWFTLGCTALGVILYLLGHPGLPRPDLEEWLQGEQPAVESPPVAAIWR